jgi:hypothetical protein
MVRRFLCLAILFLTLLGASACSGDSNKPKSNVPAVPDPEGNAVPKPGGAKSG